MAADTLQCRLQCSCCNRKFNPFKTHLNFTWEYDNQGMEQIFCVTCSKKRLSDARGLTKREELIPQHPPKKAKLKVKKRPASDKAAYAPGHLIRREHTQMR